VKGGHKVNAGYSQLRWVVLLLAVAVILPTVCLLWFMSQAVKNERLAVRQKLIDIYQEKLFRAGQKTDETWSQNCKFQEVERAGSQPGKMLISLVCDGPYDGLIIYDAAGERIYPIFAADIGEQFDLAEEFAQAWGLEFAEQDLAAAVRVYQQKAQSYSDYVRIAALIGKSRCLAKLGRMDEAIATCRQAAYGDVQNSDDRLTTGLLFDAQLLLLEFLEQDAGKYQTLFRETFVKLLSAINADFEDDSVLACDRRIFLVKKILQISKRDRLVENYFSPGDRIRLGKLVAAEERCLDIAEYFPTTAGLESQQADVFRPLAAGVEVVYGLYHKTDEGSLLVWLCKENIIPALSDYESNFRDSDLIYRILDDSGRFVAGVAKPESEPFVTALVGRHFPGWKVQLYFKDGQAFEKAASRQIVLYTWTGVLVIVLILVAGGFAGRAVGKQAKLNRLKNSFIATVSHELKTPLSSMRVLVDTLLEGGFNQQQQATEYLQLISKENERLSRLIDNFLTFSRMERNKQAFDMVRASPAEIAADTVKAVQTKFNKGRCKFDVSIDENLPQILADKDAMVTALVNLLDNAYKYSYDEKQIELRVFAEDDSVCFSVKDNGIGMSSRAIKKIFSRFYQVDSSLSRSGDGCGLGLSIVKFIVDAHKGRISVESKPGKGSELTVKVPAAI